MSKKKLTRRIILSLSLGMFSLTPLASALPSQGAYDNSAAATIATAGNTMNITGKNANNILNWLTFSVAKGETVKFTDKNNYLNLVNGVDISRIYGTISGGNNVYLVNPYGILFGQGATLDNVGSFIASTRDISDVNQQAFLNDPTNVESVLYTDNKASRNKDYYPDDSPYVPTISVAEINLTNVPASATKIVLDGPSGVVLKNEDVLNKVSGVVTRKNGGEVGIGSTSGTISLTDVQKQKISLIDGSNRSDISSNAGVLKPYKMITDASGLQAMSNGNYLLGNNIDVSSISNFRPIEYSGTFDGLGYDISNLKINRTYSSDGSAGLFSTAYGTIRNLNLKEVNIAGGYSNGGLSAYRPPNYTSDAVGAVAARFTGSMSNVNVTSSVEETDDGGAIYGYDGIQIRHYGAVRGCDRVGGLVGFLGYDDSNGKKSEIRNSSNEATVVLSGVNNVGGIVGTGEGYLFHVYNTGNIKIGSTYATRTKTYYPEGIGGIAGSFGNNNGDRILSAYNTGRVFGGRFAAGIVGLPFAKVGDAYNLGEIVVNDYAYNAVGDIVGAVGTVQGNDWSYPIPTDLAYTSQQTGNKMDSYYVSGKLQTYGGDALQGTNFGTGASEAVVTDLLNKNWHGIGYENNGGDTGGNSGGNTGGDIPGTNPGGNTGGSTPGTNTGGSTGGSTPSNGTSTPTGGLTDEEIQKRIEDAKAKVALQEYNDILTGVKKDDSVVVVPNNPNLTNLPDAIHGPSPDPYAKATKQDLGIASDEKLYNFPSNQDSVGYTTTGNMNITNIHTSEVENGKIKVDMDIYNKSSIPGVLEILDDSGRVVGQVWLDENDFAASSAADMTEYVYNKVIDNFIDGFQRITGKTDVTYDNASASQWTKIRGLEIPVGTHIRITNSIDQSDDLKAYFIASTCYDHLIQTLKVAEIFADEVKDLGGGSTSKIGKLVMKDLVKDFAKEFGPEFFLQSASDQVKAFATEIQKNPGKVWSKMAETMQEKGGETLLRTTYNVVAKIATSIIATPAVEEAVGAAFDVADAINVSKATTDAQKYKNAKPLHYFFYGDR